jgi:digeranylgeranylglycerophospholipid reductase
MHDVVVVGGGPAGLYAADRLAHAKRDVLVLEEHDEPGAPVHCTGILAREAFDEFDLTRDVILNELTTARFVSPRGHELVHRTRTVEAVVIDRQALDAHLARTAAASGAIVRMGARVVDVVMAPDGVTVRCATGEEIRARLCVLATGGRYGLHRGLGLGVPGLYLHTAQRELPAERPGEVELHFGRDIAPGGFAWAVPVWRADRSFVRVGVMAEQNAPDYFSRMLERVSKRWGIPAHVDGSPRQKILPLSSLARTYRDRVIAVGDAAGLVKPTTGGGIYYSLLSAAIGADVVDRALADNDLSSRRLAEYQRAWQRRLRAELQSQSLFRKLAQQLSDVEIEGLFELARTDGVMPIVRRAAEFNRHRRLIVALLRHQPARQLFFRSFVS